VGTGKVFTDRFKAFCKPHGNLPSGSIILVGSMSHLAKNGLNFYTPILVETMTRMAGRVGPGVNVIPLLPIPVGGIGSETLVWDMMDLNCWIVSTGAGQATGLPDSRDTGGLSARRGWGGGWSKPAPPPCPCLVEYKTQGSGPSCPEHMLGQSLLRSSCWSRR
jgi:hypothetical protein